LRDTLVHGAEQGHVACGWICAGEGAQLATKSQAASRWRRKRRRSARKSRAREFVQGLQEGGIPATSYEGFHDARIHLRGRYDRLSDIVPRALPALLTDATAAHRCRQRTPRTRALDRERRKSAHSRASW